MKNKIIISLLSFFILHPTTDLAVRKEQDKGTSRIVASVREVNGVAKQQKYKAKQRIKTLKNQKQKMRIAHTKKIYLENSKYPFTSSPVDHSKSLDHLKLRYSNIPEVYESEKMKVQLWSEKKYYNLKKDIVKVYYTVENPDDSKISISLSGTGDRNNLESVKLTNNTYLLTLNPEDLTEGDYSIILNIEDKASLSTSFGIREHYFEYIGIKNDRISSTGDLILSSELDVFISGDYIIEGTFYYKEEQIALAEAVVNLDKGRQLVDLSVYGKILFDQTIHGEVELRNISISFVNSSLAVKNLGLIMAEYKTSTYRYDEFRSESYNNEILIGKAHGQF